MVWMKLLGGLASLGVLVTVLGSLAGLAPALPSNRSALIVAALVALVMAAVAGAGVAGRDTGANPYW
jgi:tetrahydromethanopterin S-methyltransferase subunit C